MRLFLAAIPPETLRNRLAEVAERFGPGGGFKPCRAESLHLTLRFLGEVDDEPDRLARPRWREVAARSRPSRVRVVGLAGFPALRRARVLVAPIEDVDPPGPLASLADAIEVAARAAGFPPEVRAFRPHLTLGRARGGSGRVPGKPIDLAGETFDVGHVHLVLSELDPAGARYTVLETYPLGDPAGDIDAGTAERGEPV